MLKWNRMLRTNALVIACLILSACSSGSSGGKGAPANPGGSGKLPKFAELDPSKCTSETINDSFQRNSPGFFPIDPPQKRLADYIDREDGNCVKAVLARGAKANEIVQIDNFPNGKLTMLPIFAALRERFMGRFDKEVGVLRALVEGGADVNAKNNETQTPLLIALSNQTLKQNPNAAAYLISTKKCNLEQRDRDGLAPIWKAIDAGALETINQLIDAGANVSTLHPQGRNLLQASIGRGPEWQALSVALVQKDVDPMATDSTGTNSLHIAASNKLTDVANAILAKNIKVDAQNNARETALFLAVRSGSNPIALALLAKGANVNLASDKSSPLHEALTQDNGEIVTAILPKVTDVNTLDATKSTPLLLAARHSSAAQVKALLDRGANAKLADQGGITPLMVVLENEQTDKMNELLPKSDVNQKTAAGRTAAFFAKNVHQLRSLRNNGADLNARSNAGETLLSGAISANNSDLAIYIIEEGADVSWKNTDGDTLLHKTIESNKLTVARALLERKIDANVKNVKGETPMFNIRSSAAVDLLVEFRGNINQAASDGRTVISELVRGHLSMSNTNWSLAIIQRLVELRVNLDVRGERGQPLLHDVVTAREFNLVSPRVRDEAKLLTILIDGGAKVNGVDAKRNSALHLADSSGEVGVLLNKGADRNLKNAEQRTAQQVNQLRKSVLEVEMAPVQAELEKIETDLKTETVGTAKYGLLIRRKAEQTMQLRIYTDQLDQVDKILALLK